MAHHLDSFRARNQANLDSGELDKRLIELSALFEISQTLNSSLNLKSILDNILLVPMGRMMISKGMIMLQKKTNQYVVENLKGLPQGLLDKEIHISHLPDRPALLSDLEVRGDWIDFFSDFKIELIIPLISKRDFRGLLCFGKKLNRQPYSDEEVEFLDSLANIAIQSIENAVSVEKLNQANRELDNKIQELQTLFEIGRELNRIFSEQEILKQLSYSLMGQMLINQFFVALKVGQQLKIAYSKGSLFREEKLYECLRLCEEMPEFHQPVILQDDDRFGQLYDMGVRLIVPMQIQETNGGYIFLGEKLDKRPYSQYNLDFLSTLANIAMISLENARLFEETLEKQKMEEELNLAKSIQALLLPSQMPKINSFNVHGINMPSKQIGGDYFDIIRINEDEYIFTIADVSGKGMPAALLMSNLQAGLQTLAFEEYPLAQVTAKLNNLIYKNTSIEKYITFFILKLNTKNGSVEYVNAGHNPPFLLGTREPLRYLDKGGIILGMMAEVEYETGQLKLHEDDCIIMYTDGITEAMDDQNNEFGEERLIQIARSHFKTDNAYQLISVIIEELKSFCGDPTQYDDVTILAIKANHQQ